MTTDPKITVVIPNLNVGAFLEQTIQSVLEQDYPNLDLIVVDGGSTDNSIEIIERYRKHFSHVIIEPDKGQADALNKGFRRASGDILGWLNSDDIFMPGALKRVGRLFQRRKDVSWITGRLLNIDEEGGITHNGVVRPHSRIRFLSGDYQWIQQESTFWRKELWEKAGGTLDLSMKLAVDGELWFRFFQFAPLHSVNMEIGAFRIREGQRSGAIDVYHREMTTLIKRYRDTAPPAYKLKFADVFGSEPMPRRRADAERLSRIKSEDLKVIEFSTIDPTLPNNITMPKQRQQTQSVPSRQKPSDLSAFRNRHAGQRCFVMGNGPSLNKMDLGLLEGETVFAANSAFLLFDRIGWRPKYYSCVDTRVLPDTASEIEAMHRANPDMTLFFPSTLKIWDGSGRVLTTRDLIGEAPNRYFFQEQSYDPNHLPQSAFSMDCNEHLCLPNTVTITLLQLAVYMGFTDIYLIGCDTSYSVPKTVAQDGPDSHDGAAAKLLLTSTEDDDPNHFDNRYFGKGRKWHAPKVQDMIFHYQLAAQVLTDTGIRVHNATLGGNLEVFPRVDFSSLFGAREQANKAGSAVPGKPLALDTIEAILADGQSIDDATRRQRLLSLASSLLLDRETILQRWDNDKQLRLRVEVLLSSGAPQDVARKHLFEVWAFVAQGRALPDRKSGKIAVSGLRGTKSLSSGVAP